jgi:hypothetical protein
MEIHRAVELGQLYRSLGIDRDARVSYRISAGGVVISDIGAATQYTITQGNTRPSVARFEVPGYVVEIISATDDQLKRRWSETWLDGWSDERETIFTELTYRGVSMLGL